MIRWVMREAEKDPALIQLCLQCKHVNCLGECERFISMRNEIAMKLKTVYLIKRKADMRAQEASALHALIAGANNGAIARIECDSNCAPMRASEIQDVLRCSQFGAINVCKLYGAYIGKRKYVTRETLIKLLTEVENIGNG